MFAPHGADMMSEDLLLKVKDEAVDHFIQQVGANYENRTGLKPDFYVAEIGDGAHRIN